MKNQYVDDDSYARIWITGPFWQLSNAKRLFEAGKSAAPVNFSDMLVTKVVEQQN